jgi:hypothetical protein
LLFNLSYFFSSPASNPIGVLLSLGNPLVQPAPFIPLLFLDLS